MAPPHGQLNIDNGKLNSLSSRLDNSVVTLILTITLIIIINIVFIKMITRR